MSRVARVEVGELKKYPDPPTPFEVDTVSLDLAEGRLARNQLYTRCGLVGVSIPGDLLSRRDSRTELLWVAEAMKYSKLDIKLGGVPEDPALILEPSNGEGLPRLALSPFLVRGFVNAFHIGVVNVSEEGFAFARHDLAVPNGVDKPLGKTLERVMRMGEATDLLRDRTYVWVGPEHAGKNLFRVSFGGNNFRTYHDAVMIGPMEESVASVYQDGSPINTVYPRRIVQVKN